MATFTDPGNPSNTLQADYSATINWGDSNTSPGSFVYDTVNNVWDVQGSHTYAEGGDFTLTVTINIGTQIVTASSTVTVADVPLTNVTGARLTAARPAGVNVGLIEDSLPWSYHTDVDSDTTVATGLGYTVTKIPHGAGHDQPVGLFHDNSGRRPKQHGLFGRPVRPAANRGVRGSGWCMGRK